LIIGPQQNSEVRSSMQLMRYLANREQPVIVPFYASWIDVRDVAIAHRLALDVKLPEGFNFRRYFVSSQEVVGTSALAQSMNKQFPKLYAPTIELGGVLMWFASFFDERLTDYIRLFLSQPRAEASPVRAKEELGFTRKYTSLDETVRDVILSFGEHGIITDKEEKLEGCDKKRE
jgi:dihydroflavonol-4-reductase